MSTFNPKDYLIHHSDRGVQYASYAYTDRLKRAGVSISMTEYGNPKDNAVAEGVNNTIKNELFKGMEFHSIGEVRQALKVAVDFYNNERPHWSLDGMTPVQAARMKGEIQKKMDKFQRNRHQKNADLKKKCHSFASPTKNVLLMTEQEQAKRGTSLLFSCLFKIERK